MATVTIRQISRSGADWLLRIIGFLFWMIRTGGLLALFVEAVRLIADFAPLNARQCALYAGMGLLGWAGSRLCALVRSHLKASDTGAELPAQGAV